MKMAETPLFQRLLEFSPFSERELAILIVSASARYKTHRIAKRHGRGTREISQPTSEVKYIQRIVANRELNHLRVHSAATAYRAGLSILDHAQPHAGGRYLLKMDFKDFFPSLGMGAIARRLSIETGYSDLERWILCRILTKFDRRTEKFHLAIGAPSSPLISNFLLFEFDQAMSDFCSSLDVRYTRYADDLAFSTQSRDVLRIVEAEVGNELLRQPHLGLRVNTDKTVHTSMKHRRTLVGLTLTNAGNASIGRVAKRELRVLLHRASIGELPLDEYAVLRGRLSFASAIDADYIGELLAAYGFNKIQDVEPR